MRKEKYKNIILEYFSVLELEESKDKMIKYGNMLKYDEPRLIHGDIKRENIMVSENEELYITDIESMEVSYDILNFKYQMTWTLFEDNEKELEFVKGYLDGIYNNNRPKNFNYYIIFIVLLNFFTESYHKYKCSNVEKFTIYIQKCKVLFDKLKKVNIDGNAII